MPSRLACVRRPVRLAGVLVLSAACGGGRGSAPPADDSHALIIPPLESRAEAPPSGGHEPQAGGAPSSLAIRARDPRLARRPPRSRAHVLGDVQRLERQLASTTSTSPDRPTLRLGIADAYDELAYTSSGFDAERARDLAIRQYVAIRGEHPRFDRVDEVTYHLALAYELNGDRTSARRLYFELIANHAASKLVPLAYFAFGELFSAEARHDPTKNVLALHAYMEVLELAPEAAPIHADTLLRIGETHLRMNEGAPAKEVFDRLRREHPDSEAAARIPADQ